MWHHQHFPFQPEISSPAKLEVLLSLLCATWWCSLKSLNEDISGAVYAEQSHLRLTLPQTLRSPAPDTLLLSSSSSLSRPPPFLAGSFLCFLWGIALPRVVTSIAAACLLLQLCRLFPAATTHNNLQLVGCNGSDEAVWTMHLCRNGLQEGSVSNSLQNISACSANIKSLLGHKDPNKTKTWNDIRDKRRISRLPLTNSEDNGFVSWCIHSSSIWIVKDWHPWTHTHTHRNTQTKS